MARPQKEGLDYFSHDTDAVNDEKIEALRALYGNDGYAFFFILLERIYRVPDAELDVSDAETLQILARKVSVTEEKFQEMLKTAIKRGCFNKEAFEKRGVLTSNGIKKRASVVIEKREVMRSRYQKAKLDSISSPISDAETIPETPQSKVKESKEKNSKIDNSSISKDTTIKKNIYTLFEQEIGMLTPMIAEQLKDAESVFPDDWIEDAIKEAARANVRRWSYIEGILKNWATKGRDVKMGGKTIKRDEDPDKYLKGRYGHMVRRK